VSLKPINFCINSSGFFIIFKDDFHSTFFGFLFLSTSIASFQNPANKNYVAANTSGTPEGGLDQLLAV